MKMYSEKNKLNKTVVKFCKNFADTLTEKRNKIFKNYSRL